jgi:hypothetical protein
LTSLVCYTHLTTKYKKIIKTSRTMAMVLDAKLAHPLPLFFLGMKFK